MSVSGESSGLGFALPASGLPLIKPIASNDDGQYAGAGGPCSTSPVINFDVLSPGPRASERPEMVAATCLIDVIDASGDCTKLRPQQRLQWPEALSSGIFVVRDGILAVDAKPARSQRQILDFLLPGDVAAASALLSARVVSIRAITSASLFYLGDGQAIQTNEHPSLRALLLEQFKAQITRSNIHQLVIGQLDTESRVASFLLTLALCSTHALRPNLLLPLPMSRDDIADYLAMNRDTLSRIMMRLETLGQIERVNRHAIRVADFEQLSRLTPIASLLAAVFGRQKVRARQI